MTLRKALWRSVVPKRYHQVIVPIRQRRQAHEGAPPGLDPDWLNSTIADEFGVSATSVAHMPLTSYKSGSAFRVWVRPRPSRIRTLIFKEAQLDPMTYPAIVGFPGEPGLPEWSVLSNAGEILGMHLPSVYATREVHPGTHFQYLMQDLVWSHRNVLDENDTKRAIFELPAVHEALSRWARANSYTPVVNMGVDSSLAIVEFAERALRQFAEDMKSETTSTFLERWDEVIHAFLRPLDTLRQVPSTMIHGDFNRRNIFLDARRPAGMKLVDWEWMASGPPHADLASIMKRSPWDLQQEAVSWFFRNDDTSHEIHWEVYLWCRIVRSLLDAALHANQNLSPVGHTPSAVIWHLERLNEVLAEMAHRR